MQHLTTGYIPPSIAVSARTGRSIIALLGALISGPAWAEEASQQADFTELSLEELVKLEIPKVSAASKYEQRATDAPASVTVVTREEIRRNGYVRLSEALSAVRGFYIRNERTYEFLGTRGFNRQGNFMSRILVLIDGHRLNDSVYQQGPFSDFPLDMETIERIEIIRGPGSSLYGSSAFFGVINVITRQGRDLQGAELSVGGGSYDTYQGAASLGKRWSNGLDVLVSLSGYQSDGNDHLVYPEVSTDPAFNYGVGNANDSEHSGKAYLSAHFGDFALTYAKSSRRKYSDTTFFDTVFNSKDSFQYDQHEFLDLQFQHRFDQGHETSARLFLDSYYYQGDYVYPGVLNRDYADSRWWGTELRHRLPLGTSHTVTAGLEYINYYRSDQGNADVTPAQVYFTSHNGFHTLGLFLQDEWKLSDRILFNIGLRYDDLDNGSTATSPRAGLIIQAGEGSTIKLLAGSAFRAPNDYERLYQGVVLKPNLSIEPERTQTYEAVLEQAFNANLRGLLSVYEYRIKNLISQVTDPSDGMLVYRNEDRVRGRGIELEFEGRWPMLEGRISYSHQEARITTQDVSMTDSPQNLFKLNVMVPLGSDKYWLAWETQYDSSRYNGRYVRVDGYSVSNLTLSARQLLKGLDLSVSVYNLFDDTYYHPASDDFNQAIQSIPQDGRSYRLKATVRF